MPSTGPVEFIVETAELGRLRTELQTLQTELGDLPTQEGNADPAAFGGDVAGAVDRFAVHWTEGRARITDNVGQCLALTEGAIDAYTGAETTIQNAAPVPAGVTTTEAR
jgi:hypothetical protein